jgi:hypothetical protein
MKYVHHADFTCLTQSISFSAAHKQLERYTFPFSGQDGGDGMAVKSAVRAAVKQALQFRANRGITIGRMHVEMDEDNPGSGRVVDHVARIEEVSPPTIETPVMPPPETPKRSRQSRPPSEAVVESPPASPPETSPVTE